MTAVLDEHGRAVVFDRVTGEVHHWPAPTAAENIARSGGRYVHGTTGKPMAAPEPEPVVEEPPVALRQEEVLDLPIGEEGIGAAVDEPVIEPVLLGVDLGVEQTAPRPRPRPRAKAARRAKK